MANTNYKFFAMFVFLNIALSLGTEFTQPNGSIEGWLTNNSFVQWTLGQLDNTPSMQNTEEYVAPQGDTILVQTGGISLYGFFVLFTGLFTVILFGTIVSVTKLLFFTGISNGILLTITLICMLAAVLLQIAAIIRLYEIVKNQRTD